MWNGLIEKYRNDRQIQLTLYSLGAKNDEYEGKDSNRRRKREDESGMRVHRVVILATTPIFKT